MGDLVFAFRSKKKSPSTFEIFEQAGLVKQLEPEWERALVEEMVRTHPVTERDFGHVLNNPPKGILPSQILRELHDRSEMIPTLFVVQLAKGKVVYLNKVVDHYQLFALLADVRADGYIEEGGDGA